MRYEYVKPDRKFHGPVHWGHVIHLYCSEERIGDLRAFLDTTCGENTWRLRSPFEEKALGKTTMETLLANTRRALKGQGTRVKFADANHAMRLKLMWVECEAPAGYDPVILPLIRRVMPSVMAQDIVGVQPMTAPNSSIYTMRIKGLGL